MGLTNYILNGHEPVPEPDIKKWADWFENNSRIVKQTEVGSSWISTVFLGIDHNFMGLVGGDPILFETMIFGGLFEETGEPQRRYRTWDEAESGHNAAVNAVELFYENAGLKW